MLQIVSIISIRIRSRNRDNFNFTTCFKDAIHEGERLEDDENFENFEEGVEDVKTADEEQKKKNVVAHYKYTGSTLKVHPYLSQMINYCQSIRFPGWKVSKENDCSWKMSSFRSVGN